MGLRFGPETLQFGRKSFAQKKEKSGQALKISLIIDVMVCAVGRGCLSFFFVLGLLCLEF